MKSITLIVACLLGLCAWSQNLSSGEYFFDTDPGVGNGISLPSFSPNDTIDLNLNINTTGLTPGFHQLYIRFRDAANKWGIYEGRTFHVQATSSSPTVAPLVASAEYYFDTDPGVGNGTNIPSFSPNDTIDLNLNINTIGLTPGFHQLYIRFRDAANKWGIYEGRTFHVQATSSAPTAAPLLASAEYYFDTDPGVGNGIPLPSFSPDDTVDLSLSLNVSALSAGSHQLYIRFKDAANKWGIYEVGNFNVLTCNAPTVNFTPSTNSICLGDTLFLTDISTSLDPSPIYSWDINNDGSVESTTQNSKYKFPTVGTFDIKLKIQQGLCVDSIIKTITVNPNYSSTQSVEICSGDSYTFPDNSTQTNITATVTQTSSLQSSFGCDSIIVTTVSVKPTYNQTTSTTICRGSSFTFPDNTTQTNIIATVTQTSNLQSSLGCDSIIVTTVNVNPTYNQTANTSVCSGGSFTFPDNTTQTNITSTVTQTSNLQSSLGCDSIIVTTVNVNPTYNQTASATICSGSSFTFPDNTTQTNITSTVTQTSNLQSSLGCDSIIVTTINVNPTYNQTASVSICSGSSFTFPDNTTQTNITATMSQTSTFQSRLGCDSIIVTTVNVNPVYNQSNNVSVCIGGSYTFPDNTTQTNITATVSQTSTLQSSLGCDSIIVTTVNVNPTYNQTASATICSGDSYTFPDNTTQTNITATVTQTSNLQSSLGCDSIIVTTVNVNPTYNQTASATICSGSSFTFPDNTTQTNITSTVTQTSNLQSSLGCDSIIVTTINVNPTYNQTASVSICSGSSFTFPDNTTQTNITATISQTSTFQSRLGCDSIIVTTVNVNPVYNLTNTVGVCSGDSYTFPDNTTQTNITATVTQTSFLQSSFGCDSIIVTTVSVKPTYNQTTSTTICSGSSFTFPDNTTQTNIIATVTQTSNLQSSLGCDSIIVTTVNVNPTYNQTASTTICSGSSFTFPDNTTQTNITSTVTQTSTLQSNLGCDSIIVTTVNVNPVYNLAANATVCSGDSFTFPDNTTQTNITTSVTQTSSLQSSLGCDSIIVTTLNVTSIDTTLTALNNTMTANQNGATYQWFTCVGNVLTPISGATNQSYTTSISGNYSVEITLNGCKDTSNCYAHIGVGIDNLTIQKNLFIFPNPNNGDFKVKSDNLIMEGQLKIRTMSGQVVYINRSNGFEFSIDLEVNSGVYLIEINTENSRIIKKLIIR